MDKNLPPQNLEAERAVIGSVLIDNMAYDRVSDFVRAEYFYEPRHRIIFEAIMTLSRTGKAIDILTLSSELKKKKKYKESGGSIYFSEIVSGVPTSANVKNYAEIVKEMYIRRSLISFGAEISEKARNEKDELEETLNTIEQKVLSLTTDTSGTDFLDTSTLLDMQMARADEYAKNPDGIRGHATGWNNVDKLLQGLHNSDFIILAARPSVGKSAFAINIARHVAVENNKSVALFSLEMPAVQVMERILAQQMKVDLWNIRMGKLEKHEVEKYPEAAGRIGDANLFIDETPGINMMQLRSKARKLKMDKGLDMIIIDYLQLMQTRETDNRAVAVGEMSRALKILARELNIPILTLAQLNRSIENRPGGVPQLSDLRESGSIEQDADLVMFLNREFRDDDEDDDGSRDEINVDLHVAKHRNGPIGKVSFKFVGRQQRFEEIG